MPTDLPRREADKPSIGALFAMIVRLRIIRLRLRIGRIVAAIRGGRRAAGDKEPPR